MTREAMSLKPPFSRWARIRPALFPAKASGLMIVSVLFDIEELSVCGSSRRGYELTASGGVSLLESCFDEVNKIDRPFRDAHARRLERFDFFCGGSGRTRNNRAGVAHSAAWRSGLA